MNSTWKVLKNSLVPWRKPTSVFNVRPRNSDALCFPLLLRVRALNACWNQNEKSVSAGCQSWYLIEIYFWAIKWFIFCLFCTVWAYSPFSRTKAFIFAWKMRSIIFVEIFIVNICKGDTFPMQKYAGWGEMLACIYVHFPVRGFHRFYKIFKKSREWKMLLNNWPVGKLIWMIKHNRINELISTGSLDFEEY